MGVENWNKSLLVKMFLDDLKKSQLYKLCKGFQI